MAAGLPALAAAAAAAAAAQVLLLLLLLSVHTAADHPTDRSQVGRDPSAAALRLQEVNRPAARSLSSRLPWCFLQVGRHPNADALYLEEIDLGEGQPRQVGRGSRWQAGRRHAPGQEGAGRAGWRAGGRGGAASPWHARPPRARLHRAALTPPPRPVPRRWSAAWSTLCLRIRWRGGACWW